MNTKRNYGLIILRCLIIFGVVVHHTCTAYSGVKNIDLSFLHHNFITTTRLLSYNLFLQLGVLADGCFMLITGYLLIDKDWKFIRVMKVFAQAFFYFLSILIIGLVCFKIQGQSISVPLIYTLRTIFTYYWYIVAYTCSFFFAPFLNNGVAKITKNQYKFILLFLSILEVTVLYSQKYPHEYNGFFVFLFMYLMGGYIKIYNELPFVNMSKIMNHTFIKYFILFGFFVFNTLFRYTELVIVNKLPIKWQQILNTFYILPPHNDYLMFDILTFIQVLYVSYVFLNVSVRSVKFQNILDWLAPAALSVYLISHNPITHEYILKPLLIHWHHSVVSFKGHMFILTVVPFIIWLICIFLGRFMLFLFKTLKINNLLIIISNYLDNKLEIKDNPL